MLTVWNTNAPTVNNAPLATPNIIAIATTVLFAAASATPPVTVQTTTAPFATTQAMSSLTALSWRTPAAESSLTTETLRACDLVLVVQVFKGGNVMVQGLNILFTIIHLPPLTSDSPFTFTILVMFSSNHYRYIIW